MQSPRYVILAEAKFNAHGAKTAGCLIRYEPEQVAAVIDSTQAGLTVQEVLGYGGAIPVVATLPDALPFGPDRLLIGTAPTGGALPASWRGILLEALAAGLDLVSGLHTFLADDPEFMDAAERYGCTLTDLRRVPEGLSTPNGSRDTVRVPVILTVGSDCNVGKMTVTWQIARRAAERGRKYGIAATGQTGRLLAGTGFAVDRVIADFLAGAGERLVVEASAGVEAVVVEGQGSLLHHAYSGVTLGLMHGAAPDAMVLCHAAGRTNLRHLENAPIPPLPELVRLYEQAAAWRKAAPVVGIALDTHQLPPAEAQLALERARADTGLPVEDVIGYPTGDLFKACDRISLGDYQIAAV